MHEISLVSSIWKTLDATLSEEELDTLTLIRLKIGELSCVDPTLLDNAYQAMVKETRFEAVELTCERVPARAHCARCDQTFRVRNYRFVCPTCDQPTSDVRSGEEFLIENVEFSTAKQSTNHHHNPSESCVTETNRSNRRS
jgi:hydrogenase nickel incorporation protein HypA/HybF